MSARKIERRRDVVERRGPGRGSSAAPGENRQRPRRRGEVVHRPQRMPGKCAHNRAAKRNGQRCRGEGHVVHSGEMSESAGECRKVVNRRAVVQCHMLLRRDARRTKSIHVYAECARVCGRRRRAWQNVARPTVCSGTAAGDACHHTATA